MHGRSVAILLLFVMAAAAVGYAFVNPVAPFTDKPLYTLVKLGLDLKGGTHVVLEAQDAPGKKVDDEAMRGALKILQIRVNGLGVSEPVIQRQGDRRIIVELAGVKDPEEAVKIIGKTALLEFKDEKGDVIISGSDLQSAQSALDSNNQPVVTLQLKPDAKKKFAQATTENVGKPINIYLDQDLVQSPVVQAPGIEEPEITGYSDLQDAQNVAMLLNSGMLPVPLKVVENRIISATLGQDSINRSRVAATIGVAAVVGFMALYYLGVGLVADLALLFYILLVMGVLIWLRATLTLPGIAGVILSVGMAVDANVIIFERIKEEIRNGKTLRSALDAGHARAFAAILDSNVTTLIGAAVLFYFGEGPIKGFAVTLSVGILTSMFTAIIVTRYLVRLLMDVGLIKTARAFLPWGARGAQA